jgi:POT family proton-dependent oligopeptide transporter
MYIGLALIALGSGGIKPCVSANVGDQFGKGNWFRVTAVFQIFYFSVNFGSFFSTLSIPLTKEYLGNKVAFAIPGVLMLIATMVFWFGRKKFVHVPPKPGGTSGLLDALSSIALFLTVGHLFFTSSLPWWLMFVVSLVFLILGLVLFQVRQRLSRDDGFLAVSLYALGRLFSGKKDEPQTEETIRPDDSLNAQPLGKPRFACGPANSRFWSPAVVRFGLEATEGPVAVLKIITVFFLVSLFWALFDQNASSWVRQAAMMNLTLWNETKVLPNQIQALNPLFVMLLIPIMNVVYKALERTGIKTTPLRRMTVGMFLTALSFVTIALLQHRIDAVGLGRVWFGWQVIGYVLLTIGEVMVSITGLEFAYTQAPPRMKSTIMGFWLLTVSLGNVLVAVLARFGGLPLADFFWVFAGLMGGASALFGLRSYFYVQKDYPQV